MEKKKKRTTRFLEKNVSSMICETTWLTSRSRVSRVGSLIIVHAVLINQFFKRNNVGRCTYEYFFRFFFFKLFLFFFLSLDVIVK